MQMRIVLSFALMSAKDCRFYEIVHVIALITSLICPEGGIIRHVLVTLIHNPKLFIAHKGVYLERYVY